MTVWPRKTDEKLRVGGYAGDANFKETLFINWPLKIRLIFIAWCQFFQAKLAPTEAEQTWTNHRYGYGRLQEKQTCKQRAACSPHPLVACEKIPFETLKPELYLRVLSQMISWGKEWLFGIGAFSNKNEAPECEKKYIHGTCMIIYLECIAIR